MKKVFGLSVDFILVLLLLGIFVVVAIPGRIRERPSPLNRIFNNLRAIESAKEQWALEHKKNPGDTPRVSDLAPYFRNNQPPSAIVKEKYEINPLGIPAAARLYRKVGHYQAGSVITVNAKGEGQLAE